MKHCDLCHYWSLNMNSFYFFKSMVNVIVKVLLHSKCVLLYFMCRDTRRLFSHSSAKEGKFHFAQLLSEYKLCSTSEQDL